MIERLVPKRCQVVCSHLQFAPEGRVSQGSWSWMWSQYCRLKPVKWLLCPGWGPSNPTLEPGLGGLLEEDHLVARLYSMRSDWAKAKSETRPLIGKPALLILHVSVSSCFNNTEQWIGAKSEAKNRVIESSCSSTKKTHSVLETY